MFFCLLFTRDYTLINKAAFFCKLPVMIWDLVDMLLRIRVQKHRFGWQQVQLECKKQGNTSSICGKSDVDLGRTDELWMNSIRFVWIIPVNDFVKEKSHHETAFVYF